MTPLSVYILTYNSERHLEKVLSAAKRAADDLLIVDSGSSDATLAIAAKHGARIAHRTFDNFRAQRQFANSLCMHETVMFFDSDEIASDALIDEIAALKDAGFVHDAYAVRREWVVMGRLVHALMPVSCPDYPIRIYRRDTLHYSGHTVHETLMGHTSGGRIESPLIHHTFETKTELMHKLDLYTDLAATDLAHRTESVAVLRLKGWLSPLGAFLKWYIRKGNIRDGRVGLMLAFYASAYTRRKYREALVLRYRD
ncbi:glycosyltransferase family 2 protein [Paraburkholderia rhynchosiae]|uniref:Glycosyl transferase family 2 n=1 Tax=Paraburkholderia rhynchosiae TaxID=487049 RepID=A0ABX4V3U0_9BURK|nr:glycosyltransferase family 2 protein [Paraburkholderia rhynchosiae]PMS29844.1 glycosyl transferase family 2 [Paraburkholderia rhynchosiae]